ncbi:hypothetical protein E0494_10675, partial [Marinilabiliaceae bacterium JC040]|nr:hypothetical protein [Marinilabiliaceae bacterium JC040]
QNDYYPFGGVMSNFGGSDNKYLYNGKELQEGTDWLDYGARMYDGYLGRFFCVDIKSDKYASISHYSTSLNNPILFLDPDGKEPTKAEAARMAAHVYGDKKNSYLIGGWRVSKRKFGLNAEDFNDEDTGLYCQIYERLKKDGSMEYTLAYRGTELNKKDIVADLSQPLGLSSQYEKAASNMKTMLKNIGDSEFTITGHSLGGGLAAFCSMISGKKAITFNAAGVGELTKLFSGVYSLTNIMKSFTSESNIESYVMFSDPLNFVQETVSFIPRVNGNKNIVMPSNSGSVLNSIFNGHSIDNMVDVLEKKDKKKWKKSE